MENIFVFGSNEQGFHGAGSAGYAMRGDSKNTWRKDKKFLLAMNSAPNSPNRKGKLAVFGVGRGFQEGNDGKSYAICTVAKPGAKRSIDLDDIFGQICDMLFFAKKHPEYIFQCTPIGCGYAGYTEQEMKTIWDMALVVCPHPENVILPKYDNVDVRET